MLPTIRLAPHHFKELPVDGARFQSLVVRLLEVMGYRILQEAGSGPDGGRDILVERKLGDAMGEMRERVLVQCKHGAHSGRAVSDGDLEGWQHPLCQRA